MVDHYEMNMAMDRVMKHQMSKPPTKEALLENINEYIRKPSEFSIIEVTRLFKSVMLFINEHHEQSSS